MKIAYSGTQGTGKSYSTYEHALKFKLEHPLKTVIAVSEVATESPFPINKESTIDTQLWIFSNQISKELEYKSNYEIVICDRTICDCLAYSIANGFYDLVQTMIPLSKYWLSTYDQIYVKLMDNNAYNFPDGVRDTDELFRRDVENSLLKLYDELEYPKNQLILC